MYHIIVNKKTGEEKKGKASNMGELADILTKDERTAIFEHSAWDPMEKMFKDINKKKTCEESYLIDVNGIQVNAISNGYEITTLVFYL